VGKNSEMLAKEPEWGELSKEERRRILMEAGAGRRRMGMSIGSYGKLWETTGSGIREW
jgi:hypothetical protein